MGPRGTCPANGAPEARPDRRGTHLGPDRRLHAVQLQPGPRLPVDIQSPPGEVLQDRCEPPGPDANHRHVPGDRRTPRRVHGHEQRAVRGVPDSDRHREPVLPPGDRDGSSRLHVDRAGHVLHALPAGTGYLNVTQTVNFQRTYTSADVLAIVAGAALLVLGAVEVFWGFRPSGSRTDSPPATTTDLPPPPWP